MILIIGGAYQGKLDFVKDNYDIKDGEVFVCSADGGIDLSARCIYRLEEFVLGCVRRGENAVDIFSSSREIWESSIIICSDIFCGVVPTEAEGRAWREMTGRLCSYLSCEAERVSRIFCGLEQRLK